MLSEKQNTIIRIFRNLQLFIILPIIITISACSVPKGSIVILENPNGEGFTADFRKWNSNNKCELSINKDETIQIEITREDGKIDLTVIGKNGSEPYTGNNLKSGMFTVTVSETDTYEIRIAGKNATGKITVKNVGDISK